MAKKETKALMRRRKGWIGFVRAYPEWVKSHNFEDLVWDEKSKCKSTTTDVMGKEIQKW